MDRMRTVKTVIPTKVGIQPFNKLRRGMKINVKPH
jgi:hypothetical protein